MRLSFDQIKSVTVGALSVKREDDGIHFYKCTEKQIDAWYRQREGLGNGARTTTGVRLDFITNSEKIAFIAGCKGKFELHIDGLFRKQFHLNEENGFCAAYELCDPLDNKKDNYRVTIILPSHGVGVIDSVEIDDGATVTPCKYDTRMLFVGDSITQGWKSLTDSYSYAYRVSSFFNAESVIQGIGGSYFNEETFDSIPFDPDTVLIAYGTNDFSHCKTKEELMANAEAYLELVAKEYAGKRVFVITPIWQGRAKEREMGSFEDCCAIIASIAKRLGLICIDGLTLVPRAPEMFCEDMLHPNELGFSLYAENLIAQMIKVK